MFSMCISSTFEKGASITNGKYWGPISASLEDSEVKDSFARSTRPETKAKLLTAFNPSDSSVVTSMYFTLYFSSIEIVLCPW